MIEMKDKEKNEEEKRERGSVYVCEKDEEKRRRKVCVYQPAALAFAFALLFS